MYEPILHALNKLWQNNEYMSFHLNCDPEYDRPKRQRLQHLSLLYFSAGIHNLRAVWAWFYKFYIQVGC